MSCVLVVVLLMAAASSSHCYKVENTKGKTYAGFKFDVDTTGYRNLSIDAKAIQSYLQTKRYADANKVYTKGLHSRRGSTGTLRTLQSIGNAVRGTEPFFKKTAGFYGTLTQTPTSYVELYMGKGITTAALPEKVSVGIQWILLSYVAHELDVASSVAGSNAALGVEEVSDAFGIWYGYPDTLGLYSHWSNVEKWTPCAGRQLVANTVQDFVRMQAAAKAKKAAELTRYYNDFFNVQVPLVYLRAITYASGQVARSMAWQRPASGYLKIIQPLLKPSAKTTAASLQTLLSKSNLANAAQVAAALKKIAGFQGFTAKMIGYC